jgi:hypothetical protein
MYSFEHFHRGKVAGIVVNFCEIGDLPDLGAGNIIVAGFSGAWDINIT